MKRRAMTGIPTQTISFGTPDDSPFAPLHRRLGIETVTYKTATTDYHGGFDRETGDYWSPHCYRERVSLAKV